MPGPESMRSEDDFLGLIDEFFPNRHPHMELGRGDDCAVLACPERICLSTDLFIQDQHFRLEYFSPAEIGRKALAVNLSDLAGMGAKPLGFSLGMSPPPNLSRDFWSGLFQGMAGLAAEWGLPLCGGDLCRGEKLSLAVTVWGEPGPGARFLTRQGARPGDDIFLVGRIGLARAGLLALEKDGREARKLYPEACRAHLDPEPLIEQGLALAAISGTGCMMDLSDGLARDLPRLLSAGRPSPLGAEIRIKPKEIHPEIIDMAEKCGESPLDAAVTGGEDYGLIGTAAPGALAEAKGFGQAAIIGRVVESGPVLVNGRPLKIRGFDHFAPGS